MFIPLPCCLILASALPVGAATIQTCDRIGVWDPDSATVEIVARLLASDGVEAGFPREVAPRIGAAALADVDLTDHDAVQATLLAAGLANDQIMLLDSLAWDYEARAADLPLHGLLGTEQTRLRRYGDVRWRDGDAAESYAQKTVDHLQRNDLTATKLHFPGRGQLSQADIIATLRAVRAAVGPEPVLAWDPHPEKYATEDIDEARAILQVMTEEDYRWLEAPLPFDDVDSQLPLYQTLRGETGILLQLEEGGSKPQDFDFFLRWAEAGAVDMWSMDAELGAGARGVTPVLRIMQWIADHPEAGMIANPHYGSLLHTHLIAAFPASVAPFHEKPGRSGVPDRYFVDGHLLVPDWPGIFPLAGLNRGTTEVTVVSDRQRLVEGGPAATVQFRRSVSSGALTLRCLWEGGVEAADLVSELPTTIDFPDGSAAVDWPLAAVADLIDEAAAEPLRLTLVDTVDYRIGEESTVVLDVVDGEDLLAEVVVDPQDRFDGIVLRLQNHSPAMAINSCQLTVVGGGGFDFIDGAQGVLQPDPGANNDGNRPASITIAFADGLAAGASAWWTGDIDGGLDGITVAITFADGRALSGPLLDDPVRDDEVADDLDQQFWYRFFAARSDLPDGERRIRLQHPASAWQWRIQPADGLQQQTDGTTTFSRLSPAQNYRCSAVLQEDG